MFNLDNITNEHNEEHNLKQPYIRNHPYNLRSGKSNALLTLIKEQDYGNIIDKMYLYAKDLNDIKYQVLVKTRRRRNETFE